MPPALCWGGIEPCRIKTRVPCLSSWDCRVGAIHSPPHKGLCIPWVLDFESKGLWVVLQRTLSNRVSGKED